MSFYLNKSREAEYYKYSYMYNYHNRDSSKSNGPNFNNQAAGLYSITQEGTPLSLANSLEPGLKMLIPTTSKKWKLSAE